MRAVILFIMFAFAEWSDASELAWLLMLALERDFFIDDTVGLR